MIRTTEIIPTLLEIGRVLPIAPRIEAGRRANGPKPLLEELRRRGQRAKRRGPVGRERLQRAIRWVDRCLPGGPNCYRRAMMEIALDRDAAAEPFRMGFRVAGENTSGHAWVGDGSAATERYDVQLEL